MKKIKNLKFLAFFFFVFLILPTLTLAHKFEYFINNADQKIQAKNDCNANCEENCINEELPINGTGYYECPIDIDSNAKYPTKFEISESAIEIKNGVRKIISINFNGEGDVMLSGQCVSTNNNVFSVTKTDESSKTIKYRIDSKGVGTASLSCTYIVKTRSGATPKQKNERISVTVTPKSATSGADMSACEKCSGKCIIEGKFDERNSDQSEKTYKCVKRTANNLYKYNNNALTKVSGNYLCAYTSNISSAFSYVCEDEYNFNSNLTDYESEINAEISSVSCEELLEGNPELFVKLFIIVIRVGAPILLIALSAADFMKAISKQEEDALVKAWKTFGTRCVIVVLIMLLPTLLNILSRLFGIFDSCGIW